MPGFLKSVHYNTAFLSRTNAPKQAIKSIPRQQKAGTGRIKPVKMKWFEDAYKFGSPG
jgi:hypothetical protein